MVRYTEQIEWRDALLDELQRILVKSPQTRPLAGRLERYLRDAREIESEDAKEPDSAPDEYYQLREWTRDRLPGLAHPRVDSSFRKLAIRWDILSAEFPQIRDLDAREGRVRRPDDWRGIIEQHERLPFGPGPLARAPLSPAQRNHVITGEQGRLRTPRGMALALLHVTRHPRVDVKTLRRTLERAKRDKPPAL